MCVYGCICVCVCMCAMYLLVYSLIILYLYFRSRYVCTCARTSVKRYCTDRCVYNHAVL